MPRLLENIPPFPKSELSTEPRLFKTGGSPLPPSPFPPPPPRNQILDAFSRTWHRSHCRQSHRIQHSRGGRRTARAGKRHRQKHCHPGSRRDRPQKGRLRMKSWRGWRAWASRRTRTPGPTAGRRPVFRGFESLKVGRLEKRWKGQGSRRRGEMEESTRIIPLYV